VTGGVAGRPGGIALDDGQRAISYATLHDQAAAVLAAMLARGVSPGGRVVVIARGGIDACVAMVACLRGGVVLVPANPGYGIDELQHIVTDSDPTLIVIAAALPEAVVAALHATNVPVVAIAELVARSGWSRAPAIVGEIDAQADAMIIYTSGTTGRSKGCVHTHHSLGAGLSSLRAAWSMSSSDVLLHTLPLFHVHGLCVALLQALSAGATVRLVESFSPAAVLAGARAGATVWMAVPTMVVRMIDHLADHEHDRGALASLRLVTCGSAALSAAELMRFEQLTGQRILERYGMSESLITLSNSLAVRTPGAVGTAIGDTQIRVVDDELWVAGSSIMRGYWRRSDADDATFVVADGHRWLRTGDIATVDDGVVRIVGRRSLDVLKVGGYKLSTREIEDALSSHPAIAEVAVIGLSDREWGQRVCAVIVVRPGMMAPTLSSLQEHMQVHESKRPRQLEIVDTLPRNAMGKVQKQLLVRRLEGVGGATTTTP
jgi:malonyl-CoA/methylmalonyl-CoA synthetase